MNNRKHIFANELLTQFCLQWSVIILFTCTDSKLIELPWMNQWSAVSIAMWIDWCIVGDWWAVSDWSSMQNWSSVYYWCQNWMHNWFAVIVSAALMWHSGWNVFNYSANMVFGLDSVFVGNWGFMIETTWSSSSNGNENRQHQLQNQLNRKIK